MFSVTRNYIWYYPFVIWLLSILTMIYALCTDLKKIQPHRISVNGGWLDILFYLFFGIYWNTPRMVFILWTLWRTGNLNNRPKFQVRYLLEFIFFFIGAMLLGCRVIFFYIFKFIFLWLRNEKTWHLESLKSSLLLFLNQRMLGIKAVYHHKDPKKVSIVYIGLPFL